MKHTQRNATRLASPGSEPISSSHEAGSRRKLKLLLGVSLVMVVAGVFLARQLATAADTAGADDAASATLLMRETLPGSSATEPGAGSPQTVEWGEELQSFAELNTAAAAHDAVFVYVGPMGLVGEDDSRAQIEDAAAYARSQGVAIGLFTLAEASQDCTGIAAQGSVPCVVAMVKGAGAAVVSGDITEIKLMSALAAAARPSGCGAPDCGT